jgi:hypothetical protein
LRSLVEELFPGKTWYKRAGIVEMSDFAVHNLDSDSSDPRAKRALELARVMYEHQRG